MNKQTNKVGVNIGATSLEHVTKEDTENRIKNFTYE